MKRHATKRSSLSTSCGFRYFISSRAVIMEETVLVPSPNWFQASGLSVSTDGWLIYGGPSKSLCVLEPLLTNDGVIEGSHRFKAHMVNRAHKEKIVSVDINPEWPSKRNFITGSADGTVKEWNVEETDKKYIITYIHSHEAHFNEKEEVVGVGYSTETVAITVGSYGSIIKWDLKTNVVKSFNFTKNFKPMSISCSQHVPLQVAIGTKQGVIFLVDLTGTGKVLYKVRGQDDEVLRLMWCPQYEVTVRKTLAESSKRWTAMERIDRIRNEPELEDLEPLEAIEVEKKLDLPTGPLDASGTDKNLPEDSFDDSISVPEDDMFDIYKDHEADEFGHKKYIPEEVYVKVKPEEEPEEKQDDFLAECLKLKDDILNRKNEPEPSIESLVEALDKAHVTDTSEASSSNSGTVQSNDTASAHIHKHLLASVSKHGGVRIWSKTGKLVATCSVPTGNKNNTKFKSPNWPTLLWYKPDSLLISDGKNQLLECNPLKIDCKNKLEWRVVHSLHRRGLYSIMSDAPRVQTVETTTDPHHDDNWSVWTVAQDRNMIRYNMKENKKLAVHSTCGGFLYDIKVCPYDASKLAVGVGDGGVRVWESGSNDDDTKLLLGTVTTYWQNVQGKVLAVAWHPTRENLLAFSTAESRIGLIDTSNKQEKPAKTFLPALNSGVYSLSWGNDMELYASGGGDLVMYNAKKPNESPIPVSVTVEGQKWDISAVVYNSYGLLVGSTGGGVALLSGRDGDVIAAAFVFSKLIHTMDWHPQQTSDEESQYKNLLAVCSMDKQNTVVILQYKDKEEGGKELSTYLTLRGHKNAVLQLAWNPHKDGQLLSTSQDGTVRIWSVSTGECTAIFGGHSTGSMGAAWCAQPALRDCVLSGGVDCALRLWNITQYPPEAYEEKQKEPAKKTKKERSKDKKEIKDNIPENAIEEKLANIALNAEAKRKGSKRFLFPKINKQMNTNNTAGVKKVILNYLKTHKEIKNLSEVLNGMPPEYDTDYLKIFGNINGVNELLEVELANHFECGNFEAYIMVLIYRGHIDAMIQFANERDLLDPYLLSISPCVSFKYWKDVTQLYLAQIDRMIAKGEDDKLQDSKNYGGSIYRKAATLLSIHDVKGAVDVLVEGNLYKEAYILCKLRHMESVAEETLLKWATYCRLGGHFILAAICYLALGDISTAATILGKSNDQENLNIAAELAKTAGHNAFADHVEKKAKNKEEKTSTEEILEDLPKRIELLLKDIQNNTANKSNGNSVAENNGTECVNVKVDSVSTNGEKDIVNGNDVDKALNGNGLES